MSIVLRNVKGTALTYEELDNNINQLIYSASIGPGAETNTNDITLYYTGSASPLLSPRTITLTIPATALLATFKPLQMSVAQPQTLLLLLVL